MFRPITFGVLSPFFGGEYLGGVMGHLCHSAKARDIRLICVRTGDLSAFDLPVALARVDGWGIVQSAVTQQFVERLAALGKPMTSVAHDFGHSQVVSVESDNEGSTAR